ncbi:hypothetical protein AB0346_00540 [Nocardia beijingensis]|uniref:hypothetical protein n=1 Tax=Nocardia beijingensis TaxID=95162 RepID=UPI00344C57D5
MSKSLAGLRQSLDKWWWRPDRKRLATANFAVVALATAVAGTASLLIEDALPKPGEHAVIVPIRLILLIILLGLLWGALWLRTHTYHSGGTLYYTHALAEGMSDLRRDALTQAGAHHMALRTLSRWIDLPDNTNQHGVIDIHPTCAEIGASLENLINNDNPDTGYTVAPNLLWPIALAVGTYLPPVLDTRLLELNPAPADSPTIRLGGTTPITLTHTTTELDPTGARTAIVLAFTPAAAGFTTTALAGFGINTMHTLAGPDGAPTTATPPLTTSQLAALPRALADHLEPLAGSGERVVIAFLPKTVALALGWELSRKRIRFFAGTHLMHYNNGTFIPMRVHPSQPTTPPTP